LMEIHGVPLGHRQVTAYHDHSGDAARRKIVEAIAAGKSVACVSEAGTPLLADPGFALGRAVVAAGLPVHAVPGASALLAALTVAGLPTDRFAFIGFLPTAQGPREAQLADLRDLDMTLVFYESPKRVSELLDTLVRVFGGERSAAVCRELTKRFEEVRRGSLSELAGGFSGQTVKGEIVVVVDRMRDEEVTQDDIVAALRGAMTTMRVKDAATVVAGALGLPRRQVYQVALSLGDADGPE